MGKRSDENIDCGVGKNHFAFAIKLLVKIFIDIVNKRYHAQICLVFINLFSRWSMRHAWIVPGMNLGTIDSMGILHVVLIFFILHWPIMHV